MFRGCSSLTSINLSHFNTKNVYSLHGMFFNCNNLRYIDISNFIIENIYYDSNDMDSFSIFSDLPYSGTIIINKKSNGKITYMPSKWYKIIVN